ncbi:MAG: 2TM domain-containing protein [Ignavibacteria bacterium]|nr:2TM domain-containing protein [Ignavibacteria bacterium]
MYIVVNIFLLKINLNTSPGNLWFLRVVFGWGIGIAFQAFSVFGKNAVLDTDREELMEIINSVGDHFYLNRDNKLFLKKKRVCFYLKL